MHGWTFKYVRSTDKCRIQVQLDESISELNIYPLLREHCHPSQTELKIGCRVVQFSAQLPHPFANRMS